MHVAIIGAGMAGLSVGTALVTAGHQVEIFDKGRGAGGRMATRRMATALGDVQFDHGAQYFTIRDPAFAARVSGWADAGAAARWPAAGNNAWVGTPAMNTPLKAMASALNVAWATRIDAIESRNSGWVLRGDGDQVGAAAFDAVVVAVPAEQAAELLAPVDERFAELAATTRSAPCWTAMVAFAHTIAIESDILRADGGAIAWAARNSAKPGRTGPEAWVIQATAEWSIAHLEGDADAVAGALLAAFALRVGPLPELLPEPLIATAHRWRYATSGTTGAAFCWDAARRLGVCGDWLIGPRVEAAWKSGAALAQAMGK